MKFYTDGKRHLVCVPYSIENLHRMAKEYLIPRHFFHKNHYDIPVRKRNNIEKKCILVSSKDIVRIIHGKKVESNHLEK